jgi:C4-dicarboxylate transporter, DctM subunit
MQRKTPAPSPSPLPDSSSGPVAHRLENLAVVIALAAMMALPLLEAASRLLFQKSFFGTSTLVQQLTLLVGMIGGAIAARQDRLLSLSAATNFLTGRWKTGARFASGAVAAAFVVFLALGSAKFVLSEKEAGTVMAWQIPLWTVQLLMPAGFALIAWRLLWHSSAGWRGRAAALAVAGALIVLALWPPLSPAKLVWPSLLVLLAATLAGAPVFVTLGGAALILFWGDDMGVTSIAIDHYRLVTNPHLPAIPLFTLAGYFLAEGGASRRLLRVFQAWVGWLRGGPAIMTALLCAFFTSFTGASGVTILALGGLLMPVLLAARYPERFALGLLTSAGALGMLLPPCLPLILYGIMASVDIKQMFWGGVLPGFVLILVTILWALVRVRRSETSSPRFDLGEAGRSLWEAKWELLTPVIALVGFLGGYATAVEVSALTAAYTFAVETFIYRDLKTPREVMRVMTEGGLVVGGILLILGVALGFTNYMVDAQWVAKAVDWAQHTIQSPWVFLLVLNLFLLVVGCLMDTYSAIMVVVPLIVPLGKVFGIDPVHLGIVFLANLELGFLTPPVGMNLFLSSYRFGKPMSEVTRATLPLVAVRFAAVLLITYFPPLSTLLPRWFK